VISAFERKRKSGLKEMNPANSEPPPIFTIMKKKNPLMILIRKTIFIKVIGSLPCVTASKSPKAATTRWPAMSR
jgi:hypothetical protein